MTTPLNVSLRRDELVLIHTLLEVRAADIENYIRETDYKARYGEPAYNTVQRADSNYLADIRAVQSKLDDVITAA